MTILETDTELLTYAHADLVISRQGVAAGNFDTCQQYTYQPTFSPVRLQRQWARHEPGGHGHLPSELFGLAEGDKELAEGATPVLVEGPLDAIAVTIAAYGSAVGIAPLGTATVPSDPTAVM